MWGASKFFVSKMGYLTKIFEECDKLVSATLLTISVIVNIWLSFWTSFWISEVIVHSFTLAGDSCSTCDGASVRDYSVLQNKKKCNVWIRWNSLWMEIGKICPALSASASKSVDWIKNFSKVYKLFDFEDENWSIDVAHAWGVVILFVCAASLVWK